MTSFLRKQAPINFTKIVSVVALIVFLPLLMVAIWQTTVYISKATGTNANIAVDASNILEPVQTDFYHAFAQGGEEAGDMIAPVATQVKSLAPRIIRVDHIYDHYDVVSGSSGNLSYNFDRLDQVVSTIVSTGAKPLLSLSYMPSVIAKDGSVINPPNNWDDWTAVIKRTIEHYSGKGEKNLGGVYYEVWNEPDLDQFGKWKMGGEKSYLTLYQYAAKGASQATNVNGFMFGGPATTGLYKNWIIGLANSGSRIDFFSWHSYLSNPKQFFKDQQNVVSWLMPYPGLSLKPKLVTEFGFTGSKSNAYGTTYAAAHTAATIRQLISGGPQYLFTFEIVDGPTQTDGSGWGLISHPTNGQKAKPRYYVFSFIDAMKGNRVQLSGEGTWVTGFASKRDNTLRIFLVNFDASGSHVEQTPVTIMNLDPGTYVYKERFLFGRSTETEITTGDGIIKKTVVMNAQTMGILELTKK